MTSLRGYNRVGGIQIGKMEGKMKAEGVSVADEAEDDDTSSTAEMTLLDLDEDGDLSDEDKFKSENRACKGPRTILYRGDGMLTRILVDKEEGAMECVAAKAEQRGEEESDKAMHSTEVVKNCRRNKCVPSSARLAKTMKDTQSDGVTP